VNCILKIDNLIYCGTKGGLFIHNATENSTQILSKIDGIDDSEITALGYDVKSKYLIIGYASGKIILSRNGQISSIPFIENANNIIGSKKINSILIDNSIAYLNTDFGVVLYDLNRLEIRESWLNIAKGGGRLQVFESVINSDSIYLATNSGLYKASIKNGLNLMDFNNWKIENDSNLSQTDQVKSIKKYNSTIYILVNGKGIFRKNENWENIFKSSENWKYFSVTEQKIILNSNEKILQINGSNILETTSRYTKNLSQNIIDNNIIWLADNKNGLVKYENSNFEFIYPNGPIDNKIFKIKQYSNYIACLLGGFDASTTPQFSEGIYSYFDDGRWYNDSTLFKRNIQDLVDITATSRGEFIYASVWNGLIQRRNDFIKVYNNNTQNCLLKEEFGVRVTSTYYDPTSRETWFTIVAGLSGNVSSIYKLNPDSTCEGYTFNNEASWYPLEILIDNNQNKWVRLNQKQAGGLLVFEGKNGQVGISRILKKGAGQGNLSEDYVRCFAKDREGAIWCGTDNGVNVFYNPGSVLRGGFGGDATTPIFQNRPLLFEQPVNAIAVDGGNRKWLGTNNGLYLVSPDGTQVLNFYDSKNSPLPDNQINSLAIMPTTGELFITTSKGMVSLRTASSVSNNENININIFPNVIKSNFDGSIGISGLATDAIVKITDANGRLVYETQANGGTASWNGKNYNNGKLQAGVYVVLTSSSTGENSIAGKIFITE
jgi:ligand-binding sensor domain-containing protein